MRYLNLFKRDEKKAALINLIKESRVNRDYLFMLALSSAIITLGLVTGELPIIIGGMIIAPLLFPLLAFSVSLTTLNFSAFKRAVFGILASLVIVVLTAYVTVFFLEDVEFRGQFFIIALRPHFVSFTVAFLSGLSAAYAWASPRLSTVLPGVATAVSLVPPLVVSGIALHLFDKKLLINSFAVFSLNAAGVILAGFLIFLFFGFEKLHKVEEEVIKEEQHND